MTNPTSTRTTVSLDQILDVETPEQVIISYTIAGIGSRAAAALIDTLIILGTLFAVLIPTCAVGLAMGDEGAGVLSGWALFVLILLIFSFVWGYYVVWEGIADGQTPGKRRMGLRVVQDGGFSVSFSGSAVRNLVRFIDLQPVPFYFVGILAATLSGSGKRLGDMAAGTVVVRERTVRIPVPPEQRAAPPAPAAAPAIATLLTDDEFVLLERYIGRRGVLDPERRRALADGLAARFRDRIPDDPGPSPALLLRLYDREREARARGVASRSDTGAAREQHAIVAGGAPKWSAFAKRLEAIRRIGIQRLPEEQLTEFVSEYRELATDLARLRTASRGREPESLFYLSRLVAAGHNLLYRQAPLHWRTAWRYIAVEVPREIRRSVAPIGIAALLLFGPGAIAYTAVLRNPEIAPRFIPPTMIDRAEQAVQREREGRGYVTDPEAARPVWAGGIIANNVQVSYVAFASGMLAGVGTVLLLVFNGTFLGGFAGLYASKGVGNQLLAFVAPHGVLELTAICLAGGAGFLLASAILVPGAMTRREAMIVRGRRAIRLVAGTTLLLAIAGMIEGLISPIEYWSLDQKLFVSGVTALFLIFYVTRGRGASPEDEGSTATTAP